MSDPMADFCQECQTMPQPKDWEREAMLLKKKLADARADAKWLAGKLAYKDILSEYANPLDLCDVDMDVCSKYMWAGDCQTCLLRQAKQARGNK